MATASPAIKTTIGPEDNGRSMTLDEFIDAEWTGGYLYELAKGVVVVTNVPGLPHGRMVRRVTRLFILYDDAHPGIIRYGAGSGDCRIRLPGMVSDRHPDQAIYLVPEPKGTRLWMRWIPAIVVEIVSRRGEDRDYVEKREEYLRAGVLEYWIFDPSRRKMLVLTRAGDTWIEQDLGDEGIYRTHLLPGLEVSVGDILGPLNEPTDEESVEPGDA